MAPMSVTPARVCRWTMALGLVAAWAWWGAQSPAQTPAPASPEDLHAATNLFRRLDLPRGRSLRYVLLTPKGLDPAVPAPTLLAFPPGAQNEGFVQKGLQLYFADLADRGWVVISPTAPSDPSRREDPQPATHFLDDAEAIDALLEAVGKDVTLEGGKVHLAGVSNGGLAAFHAALRRPERYHSLLVLPGFPPTPEDGERLASLRDLPVWMLVGQDDADWRRDMGAARDRLVEGGATPTLEELPGQGHVLTLPPGRVHEILQSLRARAMARLEVPECERVLDAFHAAAAAGDGKAYFDLMTPDAVFLGTDPGERWTRPQFEGWAASRGLLTNGKGWKYTPQGRHVRVSEDRATAWFDEVLRNERLGVCRGTGVLSRHEGTWRLAQYDLTVPVPNDLMPRVSDLIRRTTPKEPAPPTPRPSVDAPREP